MQDARDQRDLVLRSCCPDQDSRDSGRNSGRDSEGTIELEKGGRERSSEHVFEQPMNESSFDKQSRNTFRMQWDAEPRGNFQHVSREAKNHISRNDRWLVPARGLQSPLTLPSTLFRMLKNSIDLIDQPARAMLGMLRAAQRFSCSSSASLAMYTTMLTIPAVSLSKTVPACQLAQNG